MKKTTIRNIAAILGNLIFWGLLWFLLAHKIDSELVFPGPGETIGRLWELALTADFWKICGKSMLRILLGTAAGILFGVLFAVFTEAFRPADVILSPAVTVVKATPVASFIILAMLWVGFGALPSLISALMVLPILYQNVKTGIRQVSPEHLKLRTVFDLSLWRTVTRIYLPSVLPYFVSGSVTALGLSWKAGIAAEVLATTPDSIGRKLAEAKNYLETPDLFAWTAAVILLSLCIELLFKNLVVRLGPKRTDKEAKTW